jgi:hypothetical protein
VLYVELFIDVGLWDIGGEAICLLPLEDAAINEITLRFQEVLRERTVNFKKKFEQHTFQRLETHIQTDQDRAIHKMQAAEN